MAPRLSNEKIKKILGIPQDKELPEDWANDLIIKYRDWKEEIKKKLSIPEDKELPDEWLSKLEVKTVGQTQVENELEKKKNDIIALGVKINGLDTRNAGLKEEITQLKESLKNSVDEETKKDLEARIAAKDQQIADNNIALRKAHKDESAARKEADDCHTKLLKEKEKKRIETDEYRDKWILAVGDLEKEVERREKAEKDFADYRVTHHDKNSPEKPRLSKPVTGKEAITLITRSEKIQQLLKTNSQTNLIFDVTTDDDVNKFKIEAKKFVTTIVPYKCASDRWVVVIIYNNNKTADYAFFSSLNQNEKNAPLIMKDAEEIRKQLIRKLTGIVCSARRVSPDKQLENIKQRIFLQQEEIKESGIFPTGVIKKLLETDDIFIYSKAKIEDAEESQLNKIFDGLQITHHELISLKAKYDELVRQAKQEHHR